MELILFGIGLPVFAYLIFNLIFLLVAPLVGIVDYLFDKFN